MRHLLTAILVLLLCASCHDELELPKTTWKRVVVVYIMGENSLSTYAQRDLNEIRSAMKTIPDSCHQRQHNFHVLDLDLPYRKYQKQANK